MSEESVREKERYEAREREEVVRKQRERQLTLKLDKRSSDRSLRIKSEP